MYEVGVSDGAYILIGLVRQLPPPYSQLRFCQNQMFHLIKTGKIYVGQKLHFINQQIFKNQNQVQISTDSGHYFLENQNNFNIDFNYNGIYPAKNTLRLGIQKQQFLLRNLGNIVSKTIHTQSPVSLIDVIVVKKYPIYYLQFLTNTGQNNKFVSRS